MDGDLWTQMLIIFFLIGLNAFFAASEMAIVSVRQSRIKPLVDEGNKAAILVDRFLEEPSKLLATIQIGITFAGFLASAIGAQTLSGRLAALLISFNIRWLSSSAVWISTLFVTGIIALFTLVIGELVPKRMALAQSDKIALKVAGPINFLSKITFPAVKFLAFSTNLVVKLVGGPVKDAGDQITEEEIRLMINVGEEKGIFQETETEMINSIFEFDDTVAKEVMTPRIDIVALNLEATREEILDVIIEENFSRIPVYEGSIDNIVGVLYIKDLFAMIKGNSEWEVSLKDIIRPAHFVPEYKKIDELFREMQKSKTHIAVVIDEYGGTAGIITIEDLLEEIVGNIFDEYDEVVFDFEKIDDNTYIVSGMLDIGEINDLLDTEIPEEEFDTVSGMLLSHSGKMPEVGYELTIDNVYFRIEEVDDKRISKIRVEKRDIEPDKTEEP
ncbi:MAG TPA: hemolysin family protein [Bacillota bacterium]|nr:hemolysin family protein [Bacillota bacterium]HOR85402.1 hemolysin family protein [Bacillota bacterium]HPL53082.1 hemolysin family protein [Bacillota bacterium]